MCVRKTNTVRTQRYENEVLPHLKALKRTAKKLTSNEMDAQDLVQDTLLKAYRFWESYRTGSNCRAWLYRILKNTYITEHRAQSRRPPMVDLDCIHNTNLFDLSVSDRLVLSPEDMLQLAQVKLDVATALTRLRQEFRQTLILYYWRGLSYREIASAANLPLGTVKARMYRGRRLMRDHLECYDERSAYNVNHK